MKQRDLDPGHFLYVKGPANVLVHNRILKHHVVHYSVHRGINPPPPPQKNTTPFLAKPPPPSPFLSNPPPLSSILVFVNSPL